MYTNFSIIERKIWLTTKTVDYLVPLYPEPMVVVSQGLSHEPSVMAVYKPTGYMHKESTTYLFEYEYVGVRVLQTPRRLHPIWFAPGRCRRCGWTGKANDCESTDYGALLCPKCSTLVWFDIPGQ